MTKTGPGPLGRLFSASGFLLVSLLLLTRPAISQDVAPSGALAEAERAMVRGDSHQAERIFRRIIAEDPDAGEAYEGLARALVAGSRQSEALSLLLRTGEEWIKSGEYAQAQRILEEAIRLEPDSPQSHALVGRARALNRNYLAAEEALTRAVELGVEDLRTLLYLGSTLWENGRIAEAEAIYRRTVERSGRARLPLHQLGRLFLWQGRFEEAMIVLREAAMKTLAPDLQFDLARALEGSGEAQEALAAYRRITELAPDHSKARYRLALLLTRVGEHEAAERELAVYRRLYEEEQERTRLQGLQQREIDRGYDLLRRGQVKAAIRHLKSLPETEDTLAILARAYSRAGEHGAAVGALERAIALAPHRDDLRRLLVEARLAYEKAP